MSDGVVVVDPDPRWPEMAAEEIARVLDALGSLALRIEHVGSTAVPGLAAKPTVDLMVSVPALDGSYREPLERIGYAFTAFADSPDRHFFGRPHARPRTHHVHVVAAGGFEERRHLAFRDFLCAHPAVAAEYAAVKREAARRHPDDPIAYLDFKSPFVARVQAQALAS